MKRPCMIAAAVLMLAPSLVAAQEWRQLEKEKRYDEALAALEKRAAKEPERQALFMRSAIEIALSRLKQPETAQKYVEMTTDPHWRGFFRFYLCQATGQPEAALKALEETDVAEFPVAVQTEAYTMLGNIYKTKEEMDKALDAYLNAVNSPGGAIGSYSWACKYAADIYLAKGEPEQAMAMHQKCLKNRIFIAPRHMSLFGCTGLLAKQGKIDQALDLLESEKSMFETKGYWKAVFYIEYARILNLAGMRVKAIEMYDLAEKSGATESMRRQIEDARRAITQQMILEL